MMRIAKTLFNAPKKFVSISKFKKYRNKHTVVPTTDDFLPVDSPIFDYNQETEKDPFIEDPPTMKDIVLDGVYPSSKADKDSALETVAGKTNTDVGTITTDSIKSTIASPFLQCLPSSTDHASMMSVVCPTNAIVPAKKVNEPISSDAKNNRFGNSVGFGQRDQVMNGTIVVVVDNSNNTEDSIVIDNEQDSVILRTILDLSMAASETTCLVSLTPVCTSESIASILSFGETIVSAATGYHNLDNWKIIGDQLSKTRTIVKTSMKKQDSLVEQQRKTLKDRNSALILLTKEKDDAVDRIKNLNTKVLEAETKEKESLAVISAWKASVDRLELQSKWYKILIDELQSRLEESNVKALVSKSRLEDEVQSLEKENLVWIIVAIFCAFLFLSSKTYVGKEIVP